MTILTTKTATATNINTQLLSSTNIQGYNCDDYTFHDVSYHYSIKYGNSEINVGLNTGECYFNDNYQTPSNELAINDFWEKALLIDEIKESDFDNNLDVIEYVIEELDLEDINTVEDMKLVYSLFKNMNRQIEEKHQELLEA